MYINGIDLEDIDNNIIPPLKYRLEKDIKRYDDKIDSNLFKLYILGKTNEI